MRLICPHCVEILDADNELACQVARCTECNGEFICPPLPVATIAPGEEPKPKKSGSLARVGDVLASIAAAVGAGILAVLAGMAVVMSQRSAGGGSAYPSTGNGVCQRCNGSGHESAMCFSCNGTGLGWHSHFACPSCNGSRFIRCMTCDGTGRS
jgi:hypothetical protein